MADSLAIKHAVSGLCCVWVFRSSGLPGPPQGEWYLVGRSSAGLWPPSRVPGTPRLGQGRRWPHPRVPGPPPRPAAAQQPHHRSLQYQPAVDTLPLTQLCQSTETRKTQPLPTLMPHQGETSAQSSHVTPSPLAHSPTAAAAPHLDSRAEARSSQYQTKGSRTNNPSHSVSKQFVTSPFPPFFLLPPQHHSLRKSTLTKTRD